MEIIESVTAKITDNPDGSQQLDFVNEDGTVLGTLANWHPSSDSQKIAGAMCGGDIAGLNPAFFAVGPNGQLVNA